MDKMSLIDLCFVSIPEAMLYFVVINWVLSGEMLNKKNGVMKLVTAALIQTMVLYVARASLTDICGIVVAGTISNGLLLWWIFGMNKRQSLVGAIMISLASVAVEGVVTIVTVMVVSALNAQGFYEHRILISLPARLIQMVFFAYVYSKDITLFGHRLLSMPSDKMVRRDKDVLKDIVLAMIFTSLTMLGSVQIALKSCLGALTPYGSLTDMAELLVGSIGFAYISVRLLARTWDYDTKTWALAVYTEYGERRTEN